MAENVDFIKGNLKYHEKRHARLKERLQDLKERKQMLDQTINTTKPTEHDNSKMESPPPNSKPSLTISQSQRVISPFKH